LLHFKFSKLLILQINRDNILFIYLFIDVHKHTHTHTYIHTDFLSVIFKEGKYSNWFWARGLGIRVFFLITDFIWLDQWASGNWVVWGNNAEEKVQIVNALAKVRYGGGGRGRGDVEKTTKKRRSSSQVRSWKRV
jgi:hypothetical protein